MTPREYIAKLKSERPKSRIDPSQWTDQLKAEVQKMGIDPEALSREEQETDYAEYLYDGLRPRLPPDLAQLITDGRIAIGEIADHRPDAMMVNLEPEGYAIVFNSGLRDVIYRIARALATRMQAGAPRGLDDEATEFEDTARIIAEIFWWYQETNSAYGPAYAITIEQTHMAHRLATAAETFLLAHEFGHVAQEISAKMGVNPAVLESAQMKKSIAHAEEHIADKVGLGLVLGLYGQEPAKTSAEAELQAWSYAGAEFALQIHEGMEMLGIGFATSHPSAKARLDYMRESMRNACADADSWSALSSIAVPIEAVFKNIIELLKNPPPDHLQGYEQEAQAVLKKFDLLLESCASEDPPNYMRFYEEAGSILMSGYTHLLIEHIGKISDSYVQVLRDGDFSIESLSNFKKHKLIFGYVTQYIPESVREPFMAALDLNRRSGK